MTEDQVFLAALDMPDASRSAYLDEACGEDAELRGKVEDLLAAHFKSGDFMDIPAPVQIDVEPSFNHAVTIQSDVMPAPNYQEPVADGMSFLEPSSRPDSLGRIGHYEVLQVLGAGGFGIVLRAFDDVLQRVVAVKMMAPQLAATSPARKRFLREARSSAQVRHENVVQVYEVGEQPLPHLVMEFIPGETLQQRLDRIGPLDVPEVLRIGRQIAEGLAAAHATDLIHRDIKPGNVLLEGGQLKVKITDFGLARAADDASMTQSGQIVGTPMYMAPEQVLGHALDQRADLFSLGTVMYQMVSGRAPFRANTSVAVLKRVAEDTPRNIREVIPETPQWLCDIITKLHAKNPDDRYQSAREVADVLADCEAQLKVNSKLKDYSRIPRAQAAPRGSGRKWVKVAAVLLLPVIAAGMLALTRPWWMSAIANNGGIDRPAPPASGSSDTKAVAGADYREIHGVNRQAFDAWLSQIKSEGLVPQSLAAWNSATGDLEYAAVANRNANVESWQVVHSSTKSEDRKPQIDDLRSQGYWPLAAVVTVVKQTVGHVDLWIKERDRRRTFTVYTSPVIRLETRIQEMYEQGTMMPIFLSTARHGTGTMFGQAFGPSDGIGWRVELQLTKDRLLSLLEEQRAKNWHPTCIAFYEVGGQARYLVILAENRDRWSWSVNLDLMTSEYEQELGKQTQLGFRPRHVFATDDKGVTRYGVIWQGPAVKQSLPTAFTNSFGMEFVLVPKGKSWLGGGKDKLGEKEVEIPADFYLGKYEVTQEEWEKVIGENPSRFSRTVLKDAVQDVSDADQERFPVEYVSWDQCQVFVEKLNQREKETGWVYRLPKELEWEYACRGGNDLTELEYQFDYYFDQPTNTAAPDQANFHHGENALNRTCKVGSYRPNRLGLFDMHGNVWEWCQDEVMFKGVSSRPTLGGGWDFDSTSGRAWFRRSPHPPSHRHQTMGLRLARFPVRAEVPAAQPTVLATSSFTDADVQRIAALPPAEQLEEVRQAMMRLNPGFDGTLTPTIDGGVVTGLKVLTDEVTSVAPLRALTGLTNLDLRGTYLDKGKLSDLSPLKGLALTQLDCSSTQISDLTPLAGMPLRVLAVNHNPVTDLTPLEGMPLVNLGIAQTKVTDLSPLKGLKLKNLGAQLLPVTDLSPLAGMPLTELDLYHTVGVTSLEPLRGLPLAGLNLHDVPVTDLSPLAGMTTLRNLQLQGNAVSDLTPLAGLQLTDVLLRNQQISDLSPLAGMPIVRLHIHDSSVSDLRPLQGMPLQEVLLNPINITQGIDILRAMPSLKTIGIGPNQAWPPAEFWERFDKGEFKE